MCHSVTATATAAPALPPTTGGAVPGAIPGGFSVGTQGDASYTIPITVPEHDELVLVQQRFGSDGAYTKRIASSRIGAIVAISRKMSRLRRAHRRR